MDLSVPGLTGWIDQTKRDAYNKLAFALADPGGYLKQLVTPPSPEAFAETPQEKMQRVVGSVGSVMPEVRDPALQEMNQVLSESNQAPGAGGAQQAMLVPATVAERAAWQAMVKKRAFPQDIWSKLLTWRQPGGQVTREISDAASTLLNPANPADAAQLGLQPLRPGESVQGRLSEFFSHPELEAREPDLFHNTFLQIKNPDIFDTFSGSRGGFRPGALPGQSNISLSASEALAKPILTHELGHAMQYKYGWPGGGSPTEFLALMQNPRKLDAIVRRASDIANEPGYYPEREDLWEALHSLGNTTGGDPEGVALQLYKNLAGEAGSRANEYRSGFSDAFLRAAGPPSASYDVPLRTMIMRYGADPIDLSSLPPPPVAP
jgi:hypothetical protein